IVRTGEGSEHDHGHGWWATRWRHAPQHLHTIAIRQAEVEQHHVKVGCVQRRQASPSCGRWHRGMAEVDERLAQTLAKVRVVINNQDDRHGISMSKQAPGAARTKCTLSRWPVAISWPS